MRSPVREFNRVARATRSIRGDEAAHTARDHRPSSLEPTAVDEALSDEALEQTLTAAATPRTSRRDLGSSSVVDDRHDDFSRPNRGSLLRSLADQLSALESQQRQIRRLLESVESDRR